MNFDRYAPAQLRKVAAALLTLPLALLFAACSTVASNYATPTVTSVTVGDQGSVAPITIFVTEKDLKGPGECTFTVTNSQKLGLGQKTVSYSAQGTKTNGAVIYIPNEDGWYLAQVVCSQWSPENKANPLTSKFQIGNEPAVMSGTLDDVTPEDGNLGVEFTVKNALGKPCRVTVKNSSDSPAADPYEFTPTSNNQSGAALMALSDSGELTVALVCSNTGLAKRYVFAPPS